MDERAHTSDENTAGGREGLRWDLGTLFPAKGDERRPPEWFGRALLYIAMAIVLFSYCWRSWGSVAYLIYDILIALFLALAIEPMVNTNFPEVNVLKDGWTVVTTDGSLSCHFENTVAITDGEPIILTRPEH